MPANWCARCNQDKDWCSRMIGRLLKRRKSGDQNFKRWCDSLPERFSLRKMLCEDLGGDGHAVLPAHISSSCPSLPQVDSQDKDSALQSTAASLSGGAIAGISAGGSLLLFLLIGTCVALFCWLRSHESGPPSGEKAPSCQGPRKTKQSSINILTNVFTTNEVQPVADLEQGVGSLKKSSKKSGKRVASSVDQEKPALVLKKRSSLRKTSRKSARKSGKNASSPVKAGKPPLILKKRSSYQSAAASAKAPSIASRSCSPKSIKRSSIGSKKASTFSPKAASLIKKKNTFSSKKQSVVSMRSTLPPKKGSFASKKGSFASKKGPTISTRSSFDPKKTPLVSQKPW